jgi:bifunctional non-homologous end joining protein LigD
VQPSKARGGGMRVSKFPLIEVSRGKDKKEALAGLAKWKKRHPRVAKLLEPADVLVDQMRGRSSAWYRIRINLQHVPEKLRPRTPSRARKPE